MRKFEKGRLVVATHNEGKLAEFRTLLGAFGADVVGAGALGLQEPVEDGATFEENAKIKALAAAKTSGSVALADDSGLCVAALGGAPGIVSARWNGPSKDPMVGMTRVHDAMGMTPDKSAFFVCCLALAWPDGTCETIEGRVDGHITWPPRGTMGHGYDPIFVPEGEARSFAEMSEDEKNAISHRGRALRKLVETFFA